MSLPADQISQTDCGVIVAFRKGFRFAVDVPKRFLGIGDKKIGVIGQDSLNQPIAQADLEFCIGIVFVDTSVEAASRNKVVVFIDSEGWIVIYLGTYGIVIGKLG